MKRLNTVGRANRRKDWPTDREADYRLTDWKTDWHVTPLVCRQEVFCLTYLIHEMMFFLSLSRSVLPSICPSYSIQPLHLTLRYCILFIYYLAGTLLSGAGPRANQKLLLAGESNPALPRSDDGGFRQWQAGVSALLLITVILTDILARIWWYL
jgi:hypothetical protein